MNPEIKKLLTALRDNEVALSRLYQQFAATFAEDAEFWDRLSYQEISHSEDIDQLRQLTEQEILPLGKSTLRTQAVLTSIEYISNLVEECRAGRIPKKRAYALALDLENSLIEKKFLDVFDFSMAGSYKLIHTKLVAETEKHRRWITELLKSLG
ncbi:MAG: hypothetical protein JXK94_15595 [Deltaproteobacteria bacterium]|nr:hypothetical protein [Deltaproteobacteria bacterium]